MAGKASSKTPVSKKPKPPSFISSRKKAVIVLEDGSSWPGYAIGASATREGEFVFNTSHTGYQEILTDPSYCKQVVVFTSAQIGNQGFHLEDRESQKIWASGCVMRDYHSSSTHWRYGMSLDEFLKQQGVPGIFGVDTRRLVLKLREAGSLWGVISTETTSVAKIKKSFSGSLKMEGLGLVGEVSTKTAYEWKEGSHSLLKSGEEKTSKGLRRVVVLDFGVKTQILKYLKEVGFEEIVVMPGSSTAQEIEQKRPDAVLLSNGPGDPAAETKIVAEVKKLLGKYPLFGICLGHQLLALALGMKTSKLKFGHHAANHPVKNIQNDFVEISSQNHGFAVLEPSKEGPVRITHRNMNDQTVAGFVHPELRVRGIQYHPESSPGPIDSYKLFEEFRSGSFEVA